jgi:hypothetical protein
VRERRSRVLQRALAKIVAHKAEKVEGDQGGARAARLGAQGAESECWRCRCQFSGL